MAPRELRLTWRHVHPGGAVATLPPKPARGLPGIATSIQQSLAYRGAEHRQEAIRRALANVWLRRSSEPALCPHTITRAGTTGLSKPGRPLRRPSVEWSRQSAARRD